MNDFFGSLISQKPFLIAEISGNHNGDIDLAKKLILEAKNSGADAVKIQSYTPDTLTVDCNNEDFLINNGIWSGKSLYDLYKTSYTPYEWHPALFDFAKNNNILLFSTPFDLSALEMLEKLDCPIYKIASFEMCDHNLLAHIAKTKKPVILSTGLSNLEEIKESYNVLKSNGCKNIAILHCVSSYPADIADCNIKTMIDISKNINCIVGLSDHSLNNIAAIVAVSNNAKIIEKHFTLDRNGGGPDDSFSQEPNDFKQLRIDIDNAYLALGEVNYKRTPSERINLKFRRSIYFVKDLKKNETITKDSIRVIRPGYGLSPKNFDNLIGKKVKQDVFKNTPVKDFLISQDI